MNPFNPTTKQRCLGIVIINGSCCYPGLAPVEEQVRQILDQMISETGVPVQIKTISAIQALRGGVPLKVLGEGMVIHQQEKRWPLPAVLVNGKLIVRGFPDPDAIRSALLQEYAAIQANEK